MERTSGDFASKRKIKLRQLFTCNFTLHSLRALMLFETAFSSLATMAAFLLHLSSHPSPSTFAHLYVSIVPASVAKWGHEIRPCQLRLHTWCHVHELPRHSTGWAATSSSYDLVSVVISYVIVLFWRCHQYSVDAKNRVSYNALRPGNSHSPHHTRTVQSESQEPQGLFSRDGFCGGGLDKTDSQELPDPDLYLENIIMALSSLNNGDRAKESFEAIILSDTSNKAVLNNKSKEAGTKAEELIHSRQSLQAKSTLDKSLLDGQCDAHKGSPVENRDVGVDTYDELLAKESYFDKKYGVNEPCIQHIVENKRNPSQGTVQASKAKENKGKGSVDDCFAEEHQSNNETVVKLGDIQEQLLAPVDKGSKINPMAKSSHQKEKGQIDVDHGWRIRAANMLLSDLYGACANVKVVFNDVIEVQVNTKYKTVAKKVKPMATQLPEGSNEAIKEASRQPILNDPKNIGHKFIEEKFKQLYIGEEGFLNNEEIKCFQEMLKKHGEAFAFEPDGIGCVDPNVVSPMVIFTVPHICHEVYILF
ncbi:hypothetical protein L7F22_000511 [Adiantum nelumboides]|nr:hypothetical protein [Adiantum nelumboides]